MTENTFQHKLEDLRQHFSTLEQFSDEPPEHVAELLPVLLVGLKRSLEELQSCTADAQAVERTGSGSSARRDGEHSKDGQRRPGMRFHAMAERGAVLVRIMGTETHCRWLNQAWLEFTGRSMKQLLGEGWLQDVHPEDRALCVKSCHEAFDATPLQPIEYRLRRKTGEYRWILEIGTPRRASSGNPLGYLGTAIEITKHKQAETHLALQYAVGRILSEAKTLEEAAAPVMQCLCENLGWDVGELWTVDPQSREPHCAQLWGSPSVDLSRLQEGSVPRVFPPGGSPPWQSGKPVWIADITLDGSLACEPEARHLGMHGMFRMPISAQGGIWAILRVFCRSVRQQDDAVADFLTAVGIQLGQFLMHQRSVERIRQSEARKAAILEASLDAVITIDHQGKVVEFNASAETMFGYRRQDVVGRELSDLIVPARLREKPLADFARYQAKRDTGDTGDLMPHGKRFDTLARKSDGSEFPVEVAVAPMESGDQSMVTIFVCDATARKNAERDVKVYQERMRSLMADLLLAEEHERRRLSVDLHDGLSQTIALAQIKLSALRLSIEGKLKKSLDEIGELIDQTNRDARAISFELSPPVLHDLGLQPALQWLVENIKSRYGIEVVLEDDGQPKPADEKTRVILFRSIRELLINAAKHARARRIHLRLELDEDRLNAAIEDDGVGMEPDLTAAKGSGLFSIHERLSHVGGSMRIESAPGKGTRIHLCAPLTNGRTTKARVEA